jgi:hypothetical protein
MLLRDCSTIATVYLIAVSSAISYTSNVQVVFLTPWFGAITASPYILASAVFAACLHSAGEGYWISDSPYIPACDSPYRIEEAKNAAEIDSFSLLNP